MENINKNLHVVFSARAELSRDQNMQNILFLVQCGILQAPF